MHATAKPRHSRSSYLVVERTSRTKSEFVDGLILAMAGAKPRHNAVAADALAALRSRVSETCTVLTADQRVTIPATEDSFYPDVVVVCGDWEVDEDGIGVRSTGLVAARTRR